MSDISKYTGSGEGVSGWRKLFSREKRKTLTEEYLDMLPKADFIFAYDRSQTNPDINRMAVVIINPDKESDIPIIQFQKTGFTKNEPLGSDSLSFSVKRTEEKFGEKTGLNTHLHSSFVALDISYGNVELKAFMERHGFNIEENGFAKEIGSSISVFDNWGNHNFTDYKKFREYLDDTHVLSKNPQIDELLKYVIEAIHNVPQLAKFPHAMLSGEQQKLLGMNPTSRELQ